MDTTNVKIYQVNFTKKLLVLLLVGLIILTGYGCTAAQHPTTPITLPMGYVANVQFSPFYVAQEKGYFQDAGFEVTFDYRWETDGIQLVAAGELPFTIASGDQVIQARIMGLPVKAIAAWYQKYPVAIISQENVPLNTPEDLRNLSIGIPETFGASYIGLRALLSIGHLTEDDIELQPIGYTQLALLTAGKIDAAVVYANNEPVILQQQGYNYNIMYVSDYADIVSAVLVSNDTYISENPESTADFVKAFQKGLSDVLHDPAAAFNTSLNYVEGLEENAETQREVLQASLMIWEAPNLGIMHAESWDLAQKVMRDAGLIDTELPVTDYFTNEFVQ
jgi:NitT/TauT family transport system substrate-binding protein